MLDEKQLTEKESLELITTMINKAKNSYITSGIGPLYWGILIVFCSLLTYAEIIFCFDIGFDVWNLAAIALVPQIFFVWRSKGQKLFVSHDEHMMNYVWSAFAICMFLLAFYNARTHPTSTQVIALNLIMYGIPTFITGGTRKFKPMIIGGVICWICSIASFYTTPEGGMLLIAISALSAWLIPGVILRKRYLKLKNV